MTRSWQAYEGDEGRRLAESYESLDPEDLNAWFKPFLPAAPAAILDVGAGSGRDAAWLARMGHQVVAVEPSAAMRAEGARRHSDGRMTWIDDSLPGLDQVLRLGCAFDVILVSAVWMHVASPDRRRAFRKLTGLLKPGGLLLITLRHGPAVPGRGMHPVSTEEIAALAKAQGAQILHEGQAEDRLRRPDVRWTQVALRLPDDGTGALPLLRHVIVNDAKSSTYKLGLLRAVARAADGAQGAAQVEGDDAVRLPLGLIALNWLRLYKPLLDAGLPQTPSNRGTSRLGFVDAGWHGISSLSPLDLRVGGTFVGDRAAALHAALKDAAQLICKMPASYMTFPGSDTPILQAAFRAPGQPPDTLHLDASYLVRFGTLRVPMHLWRALARHDVWIEPALVAEWQRLMEGYALRQQRALDLGVITRAMAWHEPARDVRFVRDLARERLRQGRLHCVWSGRNLSESNLDIDHCLPWTAWPCDDLWNLMPTHREVNQRQKRHFLPSAETLSESRDRILEWWHDAYLKRDEVTARRFHSEAAVALALDEPGEFTPESMFRGMERRRLALRVDHLVAEWGGFGRGG
ncbi:methyltransferase domain-containing protein [Cereibacter sphaeroides]|uniref:methyltransferase domain-containing protein n=1 Tax=Cereibacter sphaeroides TaxID=1063 RepID=UPI001F3D0F96|nr:class I SAM-dependent methyltransferase [Cereibacter sphaeroides]MCE6967421.1 methyltransferase domain-containing protein [Cereibacter sphaeroides]